MKAEDTVMKEPKLRSMHAWIYDDKCIGCLSLTCGTQADITWKAGIKEVVDWVEKMNISLDIFDHVAIEGDAWQAKLKDWVSP